MNGEQQFNRNSVFIHQQNRNVHSFGAHKNIHSISIPNRSFTPKKKPKHEIMRRLSSYIKQHKRMKKEEEQEEKTDKADKAEEGAEGGAAPSLVKEGWLRLHSETLLDEEVYPPLPLEKKPFQRKEVKQKIEVDEEQNNLRKNEATLDLHYFRLSNENIWYTATEADPIVLGSIGLKNIKAISKGSQPDCIKIEDEEEDKWELCEPTTDEPKDVLDIADWECKLLILIGEECDESLLEGAAEGGGGKPKEIIKREIIKQPLIVLPLPSLDC